MNLGRAAPIVLLVLTIVWWAALVPLAETSAQESATAVSGMATQSSPATGTVVATFTAVPKATPSPSNATAKPPLEASPSPGTTSSPVPSGAVEASGERFTLSLTFREDADTDGKPSTGDAVPAMVGMSLVPWSTARVDEPSPEVRLLSDQEGFAKFANLPPDSYSLRIYWPGGFPMGGATRDIPTILQAAFTVTADGDIVAPESFPKAWPGTGVPFDPAAQNAILGRLPSPLLLGRKDPNIASTTTDTGSVGPVEVGVIDVARALRAQVIQQPAGLPSAGSKDARARGLSYIALLGVGLLLLAIAAGITFRVRRT